MRKSARYLGYDIGLNAQEMNQLLKNQGFLSGEPGYYVITEKGKPFAKEENFHRGTGGYAHYNRYWTTRFWDESILDEIDSSESSKEQAKADVKKRREALKDQNVVETITNVVSDSKDSALGIPVKLVVIILFLIPIIILLIVNYLVPWIKEKFSGETIDECNNNEKETASSMRCPSCSGVFLEYPIAKVWQCNKCDFRMTDYEVTNSCFWYCDNCNAFLNSQEGFDKEKGCVVCNVCGCTTSISNEEQISDD